MAGRRVLQPTHAEQNGLAVHHLATTTATPRALLAGTTHQQILPAKQKVSFTIMCKRWQEEGVQIIERSFSM